MTEALIRRDDGSLSIEFTARAVELKETALSVAALVGRVSNAAENETAVAAQASLKGLLHNCEEARRLCKAPVLDFGRTIDAKAKAFAAELEAEFMRITKLVADFQQLELAKQRAAEFAARQELDRIEREKQAELAKAKSHEELEATHARYNEAAKSVPVVEPIRAKGQTVTEEWDVSVTDIHLLYRHHPNCVSMTPLLSEIKALVKAGTIPKGVRAEKKIKATVRVGAEAKTIEV